MNRALKTAQRIFFWAGSGDMVEMGVLDPTKVTRSALQNAASVAGGMPGMGGMDMGM